MKTTKKLMSIIFTIVMIFSLIAIPAEAAKVGDVVGYAQPTDIVATINGYQLESYNVDGYTYICVEDLRYYGFDVTYDNYSRSLSVNRNYAVGTIDPQHTNPKFWDIGSNNSKKKILYTDIKTYLSGYYVGSCNINGQTIIRFDSLSSYGAVAYDNDRREISLTISNMNYNPIAEFAAILQANSEYNSSWKTIFRAKGDVLMIIGIARTYGNSSTIKDYKTNKFPEDKAWARDIKAESVSYGIPVSSVYLELRNSDGSYIASYQTN